MSMCPCTGVGLLKAVSDPDRSSESGAKSVVSIPASGDGERDWGRPGVGPPVDEAIAAPSSPRELVRLSVRDLKASRDHLWTGIVSRVEDGADRVAGLEGRGTKVDSGCELKGGPVVVKGIDGDVLQPYTKNAVKWATTCRKDGGRAGGRDGGTRVGGVSCTQECRARAQWLRQAGRRAMQGAAARDGIRKREETNGPKEQDARCN